MKIAELLTEAPRGPDWKVQFKMKSKQQRDGFEEWDSGSVVVKDWVNKERARAAAEKYLEKNFAGREPKVVRITQVPWKKTKVED
jgi:hypothetical protein